MPRPPTIRENCEDKRNELDALLPSCLNVSQNARPVRSSDNTYIKVFDDTILQGVDFLGSSVIPLGEDYQQSKTHKDFNTEARR